MKILLAPAVTEGATEWSRAIHEHFVYGVYLRIYLTDCPQILHTTLPGGPVVPFGEYEL